jgi:drug/metabolite transporter (DMT)-like permease
VLTARTIWLTCLAMLAFAANSLLCRAALERGLIDPASFATIRLASGALVLTALARSRPPADQARGRTDWLAAVMLFAYVALFSFAYMSLSAGTGALILFGAVQLAMFAAGLRGGEHFSAFEWLGLAVALGGLVYLVSPGVTAPSPLGAAAMAGAGVAWGVYSLRGRRVGDPLQASAANFARAAPLAIVLNLLLWPQAHAQASGVWLAVASGAVTSGLGYVVWYAALKGLGAMRAATVQLSVPPIAAIGGVWLLSEALGFRLVVASVAILGGIALVLTRRSPR